MFQLINEKEVIELATAFLATEWITYAEVGDGYRVVCILCEGGSPQGSFEEQRKNRLSPNPSWRHIVHKNGECPIVIALKASGISYQLEGQEI